MLLARLIELGEKRALFRVAVETVANDLGDRGLAFKDFIPGFVIDFRCEGEVGQGDYQ